MNKDILHLCKGILLKHNRNEFESVLVRCMNLEPIIQSEVSQKNKNKYHVLMINAYIWNLGSGASGKELACLCRGHKRCGFNPWVRKVPWRRA